MMKSSLAPPKQSRVKPQAESQFIQQRPQNDDQEDFVNGEPTSRSRERPQVVKNTLAETQKVKKQTKVIRPQFSAERKYQVESSDDGPNIEIPGDGACTPASPAQNKSTHRNTTGMQSVNDDINFMTQSQQTKKQWDPTKRQDEFDPATLNDLVNVELDDSNLNDEEGEDDERERVCDTEQSAHAL